MTFGIAYRGETPAVSREIQDSKELHCQYKHIHRYTNIIEKQNKIKNNSNMYMYMQGAVVIMINQGPNGDFKLPLKKSEAVCASHVSAFYLQVSQCLELFSTARVF